MFKNLVFIKTRILHMLTSYQHFELEYSKRVVLQYNIDFGWEPCALAPYLKKNQVSELLDPCQKSPHRSIVLSFFMVHSVYIVISNNKYPKQR
jgi:hypothetical protein